MHFLEGFPGSMDATREPGTDVSAAETSSMEFDGLPAGWEVWSEEAKRWVLAFRPDVFDAETFPAACLPTIYVTKGRRGRRPGRPTPPEEAPWFVTFYLEPDVSGPERQFASREAARDGALDIAREFAAGDVDYHSLYQVPRPEYLEKLDELTGQ